ncbi:uncharacterized protein LOC110974116 [Acanthaster planci]|uniref:Uncharacterized protein LOC110974116 n=1 Tax=Acanthaster planci TaxID=133434 RepID=A0A8B7XLZ6_ACAPL|nr:uncharacterized protein LOC110974116 [Acanthaster planci]
MKPGNFCGGPVFVLFFLYHISTARRLHQVRTTCPPSTETALKTDLLEDDERLEPEGTVASVTPYLTCMPIGLLNNAKLARWLRNGLPLQVDMDHRTSTRIALLLTTQRTAVGHSLHCIFPVGLSRFLKTPAVDRRTSGAAPIHPAQLVSHLLIIQKSECSLASLGTLTLTETRDKTVG